MKQIIIIVLLCASSTFSAHIKPRVFREHLLASEKSRSSKIIGGQEAVPHSIPYQAGMYFDGTFCSGILITSRHLLTSANCARLSLRPKIILGAHRIEENEPSQVIFIAHKVTVHEDYDYWADINNIAIVELPEDVTINSDINTINLAGKDVGDLAGVEATFSGWGLAFDGATDLSPFLRVDTSTVITNNQCRYDYNDPYLPESVICVEGGKHNNICTGDHGGPLTATVNNETVLIGIITGGNRIGCEEEFPFSSTRISSFNDWIQQKLSNDVL